MIPLIITGQKEQDQRNQAHKLASDLLKTPIDKLPSHPDFLEINPQPSVGIQDIRTVTRILSRKPFANEAVVIIIHRAHLATVDAQNALLKSLEESPDFAQIILTCRNRDLLLPTVSSRCREIVLKPKKITPPPEEEIELLLKDILYRPSKNSRETLGRLCLPRPETVSLLEHLIIAAEAQLHTATGENQKKLAVFLRHAQLTRSIISANVSIPLAIADLLFSLDNDAQHFNTRER